MSTVIGLIQEDQQVVDLATRLEDIKASPDNVKILTTPDEAHPFVYKSAFAECHIYDCMTIGAVAGAAIFIPLGLLITVFSCGLMDGCSPLAWGPGMLFMVIVGAIIGASLGSFLGTNRLEQIESIYTDALSEGNKLVVIPADTKETATRTADALEQAHATAVKVLNGN